MAVTITSLEVAAATGTDSATATRLFLASVLVEKYGADAPDEVENEAVLRVAAILVRPTQAQHPG